MTALFFCLYSGGRLLGGRLLAFLRANLKDRLGKLGLEFRSSCLASPFSKNLGLAERKEPLDWPLLPQGALPLGCERSGLSSWPP
jgi:hypothetical protein